MSPREFEERWCVLSCTKSQCLEGAGGKGAFLPKRQSDTFLRLSGADRLPMYSMASHPAAD